MVRDTPTGERLRQSAAGRRAPLGSGEVRRLRSAGGRLPGIEALEVRVAVQARQVGVAARPVGVLVARVPRLLERFDGLGPAAEEAEGAGGVVEHGGFVR